MSSFPPAEPRPSTTAADTAWAATELIPRAMPSRHGNALAVGTRLAEFELVRVLGEGGFGIVYLARDHSLQRQVAIKEYMPAALAMRSGPTDVTVTAERHREVFAAGLESFMNEARLLARFDHASLLKVYRFWPANGTAYMVMPFYEGATLKDRLQQMGSPPDERWLLNLLASLTEALIVIHDGHWLHRDIAPDNILLLADSGRPLLLDFGAARQVIGDATQALTAILKPGYAPVEQYAEMPSMRQGPWTDVYALCAVVYAAMMGQKPPVAVARSVSDSYVPLERSAAGRYSPGFLRAIDAGLQFRPDARTASIGELRQALGFEPRQAAGPALPVPPPSPLPPSSPDALAQQTQAWNATVALTRQAGAPGDTTRPPTANVAKVAKVAKSAAAPVRATPATAAPAAVSPTGLTRVGKIWLAGALATVLLAAAGAYWAARRPVVPAAGPLDAAVPTATSPAPLNPPATAEPVAAAPPVPAPTTATAIAPAPATALAPATAPAQPARPTQAWSPLDEFDRVVQASRSDFAVRASPTQGQLRIGKDRLSFQVSAARAGHVYVLVSGADGSLQLFYPNSVATDNRIRVGQTLSLPQPHWQLDTTEPAGVEHFLVLVSEHARDFSQLGNERQSWFLQLPSGSAGAALAQAHSGAGSALVGRAQCQTAGCDVYGAVRFQVQVAP